MNVRMHIPGAMQLMCPGLTAPHSLGAVETVQVMALFLCILAGQSSTSGCD